MRGTETFVAQQGSYKNNEDHPPQTNTQLISVKLRAFPEGLERWFMLWRENPSIKKKSCNRGLKLKEAAISKGPPVQGKNKRLQANSFEEGGASLSRSS